MIECLLWLYFAPMIFNGIILGMGMIREEASIELYLLYLVTPIFNLFISLVILGIFGLIFIITLIQSFVILIGGCVEWIKSLK